MRTAIIIPARLQSTRLPEKPLCSLGGVPLVVCVARQAKKCRSAHTVVIAADDMRIVRTAQEYGCEAILTRPDHVSGSDRVAEAAALLQATHVINLQGDEPFVNPADLDTVAVGLADTTSDIVTLRAPITDVMEYNNPNVCKVVRRTDNVALYFSRSPIPYDRDGGVLPSDVYKHIGVYGFQHAALRRLTQAPPHPIEQREGLEQLRALMLGMTIRVLDSHGDGSSRGIDTPEDLAWANARVKALGEAAFP